jgi:hypothetical protein
MPCLAFKHSNPSLNRSNGGGGGIRISEAKGSSKWQPPPLKAQINEKFEDINTANENK